MNCPSLWVIELWVCLLLDISTCLLANPTKGICSVRISQTNNVHTQRFLRKNLLLKPDDLKLGIVHFRSRVRGDNVADVHFNVADVHFNVTDVHFNVTDVHVHFMDGHQHVVWVRDRFRDVLRYPPNHLVASLHTFYYRETFLDLEGVCHDNCSHTECVLSRDEVLRLLNLYDNDTDVSVCYYTAFLEEMYPFIHYPNMGYYFKLIKAVSNHGALAIPMYECRNQKGRSIKYLWSHYMYTVIMALILWNFSPLLLQHLPGNTKDIHYDDSDDEEMCNKIISDENGDILSLDDNNNSGLSDRMRVRDPGVPCERLWIRADTIPYNLNSIIRILFSLQGRALRLCLLISVCILEYRFLLTSSYVAIFLWSGIAIVFLLPSSLERCVGRNIGAYPLVIGSLTVGLWDIKLNKMLFRGQEICKNTHFEKLLQIARFRLNCGLSLDTWASILKFCLDNNNTHFIRSQARCLVSSQRVWTLRIVTHSLRRFKIFIFFIIPRGILGSIRLVVIGILALCQLSPMAVTMWILSSAAYGECKRLWKKMTLKNRKRKLRRISWLLISFIIFIGYLAVIVFTSFFVLCMCMFFTDALTMSLVGLILQAKVSMRYAAIIVGVPLYLNHQHTLIVNHYKGISRDILSTLQKFHMEEYIQYDQYSIPYYSRHLYEYIIEVYHPLRERMLWAVLKVVASLALWGLALRTINVFKLYTDTATFALAVTVVEVIAVKVMNRSLSFFWNAFENEGVYDTDIRLSLMYQKVQEFEKRTSYVKGTLSGILAPK